MTRRWILPLAVLLRILGGTPALSAQTLALDETGIRLQSVGMTSARSFRSRIAPRRRYARRSS